MKVGGEVNYYDPKVGDRQDATIVEITGAGDSLAKILTLEVNGKKVKGVHHATDAKGGDRFWLLKGVERAPQGWADTEKGEEVVEPE